MDCACGKFSIKYKVISHIADLWIWDMVVIWLELEIEIINMDNSRQ